jgi:hypothetical protein
MFNDQAKLSAKAVLSDHTELMEQQANLMAFFIAQAPLLFADTPLVTVTAASVAAAAADSAPSTPGLSEAATAEYVAQTRRHTDMATASLLKDTQDELERENVR